eukprot:11197649-Lingulodinium_polyedra.AAC.1
MEARREHNEHLLRRDAAEAVEMEDPMSRLPCCRRSGRPPRNGSANAHVEETELRENALGHPK